MDFQTYQDLFENILNDPNPKAPYDNPDYFNYMKLNHSRSKRWLKHGVLSDEMDDNSVIPLITPSLFNKYVHQGIIKGGMIPKLENAFQAIQAGVSKVVITNATAIGKDAGTVVLTD